jgi:sugar lactone lactonase YvrE
LNDKLKGIERIATDVGAGPEGLCLDATGHIIVGWNDGRVMRFDADGRHGDVLANTGGRPLGCAVLKDGSVVVADDVKGLLRIDNGKVEVLATEAGGVPFKFTDDVDVAPDGRIYFSDASSKYDQAHLMDSVFENDTHGRLLRYDPQTKKTEVLLDQLKFANGVAMGPDGAYVLVNETYAYRITRYWLKGPKAGMADTFIDNLPGFPDNLSFNGKDKFWVALYAPRDPLLDATLPYPWARKIIARIPSFLQPKPKKHAWVVSVNLDGKIVDDLQYAGANAYSPITSVEQTPDALVFGSLTAPSMAKIAWPAPKP